MEYQTGSPEETQAVAHKLVAKLAARTGMQGTATVVSLSGELGAGKTTFMQGIARSFGLDTHVTSPTFVILKVYELKGQAFDRMFHLDAYRLTSALELSALGWHEMLTNPKNILFIEWPEMVPGALPQRTIEVTFTVHDETARTITISDFS